MSLSHTSASAGRRWLMKTSLLARLTAVAVMVFGCAVAHAVPMVFKLANHPVIINSDSFGLQTKSINNLTTAQKPANTGARFTMTDVSLTYDPDNPGAGASIVGTMTNNMSGDSWSVQQLMSGLTILANGFQATMGTILMQSGGFSYGTGGTLPLTLKQDGYGFVFSFLADGFRIENDSTSWVGRGLLNGINGKGGKNNWLVTATVVPIPAAVWLFLSALASLIVIGRRRQVFPGGA